MKIKVKKILKKTTAVLTLGIIFLGSFLFQTEKINAQTLVTNVQSTYGSPYALYTFSVSYSSRTSTSIVITASCSGHLRSSTSYLGNGKGLVAGIRVGGTWRTWTLKSTSSTWRGTTSHSASTSFTVTGLSNTTTSLTGIQVRVTRSDSTGSAGILNARSVSNITIPANTSYSVTYDANGGEGAPSSQKKYKGTTLTLSSTKPTKEGYDFVGWNTSSTATTATYQPGGSYTGNAALKLYAIWSKTITLKYDTNGGTNQPEEQSTTIYNDTINATFNISDITPTRPGFTFKGWSTSKDSTAVAYKSGDEATLSNSLTLYAVWLANECEPFLKITE